MMKNVILIGFMGTGKTSTGRLLANRIGYSFIDTDNKIEAVNKMSIPEMFRKYGEKYFRERETEIIKTIAKYHHAVISTGGGVVLNPHNMNLLSQNGVVVSLTASIDSILERTSRRNSRPLLETVDRRKVIEELLKSRIEFYRKADCVIDTSNISPLQVTDKIIDFMRKGGILRARG